MWYNLLMAYSIDFRKKVLAYCERTGSITEASHLFQISRNTIYGWLKLKEKTGDLKALHPNNGTREKTSYATSFLYSTGDWSFNFC